MNSSTLKIGRHVFNLSMYNETFVKPKSPQQFYEPINKEFMGQSLVVSEQRRLLSVYNNQTSVKMNEYLAEASISVSKALRWEDKTLKPNMIEIHSAQQFVDVLKCAADTLVIVDFYSPACAACKSLHPKICQVAESNPDAIFLKVNYEELKSMCHVLHIHVLPFFRFYRGSDGRISSFSCTISTIKKFKDEVAKHSTERCNFGPAKGLDESELLKLASIGEISIRLRKGHWRSIGISNESNNSKKMADYNAMVVA